MISPASASISATTSLIAARTIRFFSRAPVVGACQTVCKSSARVTKADDESSDLGSAARS